MNKYIYYTILLSLIFFSCKQSDEMVEKKKIQTFRQCQRYLDKTILYVKDKYYPKGIRERYLNLQFVLSAKNYQKRNIFSDSFITTLLRGGDITDIVFEKASQCLDIYPYDLVKFKINNIGLDYQYYYVYEFCPQSPADIVVDKPTFKSLPLGNNWYLEIEKD